MRKVNAITIKTLSMAQKIDLNKNTAIKVLANDHGVRDGKTNGGVGVFLWYVKNYFDSKEEMNGTYVTIV